MRSVGALDLISDCFIVLCCSALVFPLVLLQISQQQILCAAGRIRVQLRDCQCGVGSSGSIIGGTEERQCTAGERDSNSKAVIFGRHHYVTGSSATAEKSTARGAERDEWGREFRVQSQETAGRVAATVAGVECRRSGDGQQQ